MAIALGFLLWYVGVLGLLVLLGSLTDPRPPDPPAGPTPPAGAASPEGAGRHQ